MHMRPLSFTNLDSKANKSSMKRNSICENPKGWGTKDKPPSHQHTTQSCCTLYSPQPDPASDFPLLRNVSALLKHRVKISAHSSVWEGEAVP